MPLPFSRGLFVYGEPIIVPRGGGADEMEQARLQIERALNAAAETADREA